LLGRCGAAAAEAVPALAAVLTDANPRLKAATLGQIGAARGVLPRPPRADPSVLCRIEPRRETR
jgi:hypothetical protein